VGAAGHPSSWQKVLNVVEEDGVIRIGNFRQLFVDDFLIERLDGLKRVYPPARKHPGNPLIKPTRDSEGWEIYTYGTCMRDPGTGLFRLWYIGWVGDLRKHTVGDVYNMNYAISTNGIRWVKPKLGLKLWDGRRDNNLLQSCQEDPRFAHFMSICYCAEEPDPSRRYKFMNLWQDHRPYAHFSSDGIHWKSFEGNPIQFDRYGQSTNTHWDPYGQQYLCAMRWESLDVATAKAQRVLAGCHSIRAGGISFSKDYIHWSPVRPTILPDEKDDEMVGVRLAANPGIVESDEGPDYYHAQFNVTQIFPYQGIYIMLIEVLDVSGGFGKHRHDGLLHTQLAFSRDLKTWTRADGRSPFIPTGEGPRWAGDWDCGGTHPSSQPVRVGDQLWFYYGGMDHSHFSQFYKYSEDGTKPYPQARSGIGLATVRLDGFAAIEGGAAAGALLTRPMRLSGTHLLVNAECSEVGYVAVEVLDQEGRPVDGLTRDEADHVTGDSVRHVVSWKENPDIGRIAGRVVRLRFDMKDARLYSFAVLQ